MVPNVLTTQIHTSLKSPGMFSLIHVALNWTKEQQKLRKARVRQVCKACLSDTSGRCRELIINKADRLSILKKPYYTLMVDDTHKVKDS